MSLSVFRQSRSTLRGAVFLTAGYGNGRKLACHLQVRGRSRQDQASLGHPVGSDRVSGPREERSDFRAEVFIRRAVSNLHQQRSSMIVAAIFAGLELHKSGSRCQ